MGVSATVRILWLGFSSIIHSAWLGVLTVARAAAVVLGYVWLGVATVLGYLEQGISTLAKATGIALLPVWLGASTIVGYLWLSVSTTVLIFRWTMGAAGQGVSMAIRGLKRAGFLAIRTVRTAYGVVPDLGRITILLIKERKGVPTMSDFNLTSQRLLSLVVTVLVIFAVSSVLVRVLWPAPPEPRVEVVRWATGHLMRDGPLPDMATQFNKAGHRTKSGKKIVLDVHNVPSELQAEFLTPRVENGTRIDLHNITDGYVDRRTSDTDPTIVTPSSAHWLVSVNHEVGRDVVDLSAAQSIVRPVIGIVTYEEMARCLGWPEKEIGYADILALRADPKGWASYPCARAEWGQRPLLAFTDPTTSSTGRSLHLALYSFAAAKPPEELGLEDVNDPSVVAYVKRFQSMIDHYLIGTTVLNTKIHQGPRYGHFFIMPEDNLIHLYEGTERAFVNGKKVTPPPISHRMVMIYPKEGSMPRKNCACIVQADWVTEEQVEAAHMWIDFIREDEQQRAFMAAGFRPGTDISLTDPASKITSRYGLDPTKPTSEVNPSLIDPGVAAAIDESWEDVKRPAIVTFVVDTSGSMLGTKLKQAKDGLIRALDRMSRNNQVGLVIFDDQVNTRIPVAPLVEGRFEIADAVEGMRARGSTALYDAIKAGIEMTDVAEGESYAIRAVVVLTDGQANHCKTRLDDLIEMEADELPIQSFSGCEGESMAEREGGTRVDKRMVIGTGLTSETSHTIQIFYIGIGDDSDMEIGRMLAGATGAEFQGVAEDDLANLLEEFSGYF